MSGVCKGDVVAVAAGGGKVVLEIVPTWQGMFLGADYEEGDIFKGSSGGA